jgi:GNAT superfamily N-acetyltransferase
MSSQDFAAVSLRDRPDLLPQYERVIFASWSEFVINDDLGGQYWDAMYEFFPEYQFALVDRATDQAVAIGNSFAITWDGDFADLPDEGWDWEMERGYTDHKAGQKPNVQCASSVSILPEYRGKGICARMVQEMKAIGQAHDLKALIAPVRPSLKSRYPLIPIDNYVRWKTDEGLPFDPWLRVHARLNASIIKVCPRSMHIRAPIATWEDWLGMRFPETGRYVVPDGLVPVEINRESDEGLYIEPNVWMVHPLR